MSSSVPATTRVLRSDCRNHGSDTCTCPTLELPNTPRRRSVSRTPSRASSVAPELTHSPSTESSSHYINGSITDLNSHEANHFQQNHRHSYNKQIYSSQDTLTRSVRRLEEEIYTSTSLTQRCNTTSTTSKFTENDSRLTSSSIHLAAEDEDSMSRERRKRQNRSVSASPSLGSKTRLENERSTYRKQLTYNAIDEGAESDGLDADESTLNLNSSMASSLSSSFRSASAHDRSRVYSPAMVTTSSTTASARMNGNHAENSHRLISVMRSGSVPPGGGESLVGTSSGHSWGYHGYTERIQSWSESVWSSIRYIVLCPPRWIYWSLVNLFVYEKWLLHQQSHSSLRKHLRKFLLLLLLLLLGTSLYSYAGLFTEIFSHPFVFPFQDQKYEETVPPVPPGMPGGIPPIITGSSGEFRAEMRSSCVLPTSWPDLTEQKAKYEELVAKVAMLEKMTEEHKRTAEENYSHQLNVFKQNLELKIHEEIKKIEPSKPTVVVEKHTIVEKPIPAPPPPEPEPIDIDKLSSTLMPLILPLIMDKVKAQVEEAKIECPDCKNVEPSVVSPSVPLPSLSGLDLSEVEKMIRAAIRKYDADKTGLPDLALEPAGGTILSTRCTKSSQSKNSVLTLWGWRVWSFSNSPRTIIQPGVVPGECWVVEGATAEVVIQLIAPAVITGFTLEHIPKAISPYGKIDTAPRKFQVVGLKTENDVENAWDYGTFEYLDNDEPIQYFPVQNKTAEPYPIVELRVLSNHGSVRSTCIYRFRVHGQNIDRTAY